MADPATAGIALGGAGLVRDFMAQGSADRARNRAMSLEEQRYRMDQERERALMEQYRKIQGIVDTARKGGVYDPNAWAKNFGDQFQKGAELIQGRTQRGLTRMGYQPSDSEFKFNTDRLNRTLAHDLAVGQVGARQNAVASEANALNMANPAYMSTASSIGGGSRLPGMLLGEADRQQPDWGATISAILPLLMRQKRRPELGGGQPGYNDSVV